MSDSDDGFEIDMGEPAQPKAPEKPKEEEKKPVPAPVPTTSQTQAKPAQSKPVAPKEEKKVEEEFDDFEVEQTEATSQAKQLTTKMQGMNLNQSQSHTGTFNISIEEGKSIYVLQHPD